MSVEELPDSEYGLLSVLASILAVVAPTMVLNARILKSWLEQHAQRLEASGGVQVMGREEVKTDIQEIICRTVREALEQALETERRVLAAERNIINHKLESIERRLTRIESKVEGD